MNLKVIVVLRACFCLLRRQVLILTIPTYLLDICQYISVMQSFYAKVRSQRNSRLEEKYEWFRNVFFQIVLYTTMTVFCVLKHLKSSVAQHFAISHTGFPSPSAQRKNNILGGRVEGYCSTSMYFCSRYPAGSCIDRTQDRHKDQSQWDQNP